MHSLKNQLFLVFSTFVFISFLTAAYTTYHFKQKKELAQLTNELSSLEVNILLALKEQERFFNFETTRIDYYKSQTSSYLENYQLLQGQTEKLLEKTIKREKDIAIIKGAQTIQLGLKELNKLFKQMVASINKRGFESFGEEGKMRKAIHRLEKIDELDLVQILMVRRHEKDFIIRQNPIYVLKHNEALKKIRTSIKRNKKLTTVRKNEINKTLDEYKQSFEKIELFDRMIGLKSNTGFMKKITEETNGLMVKFNNLKQTAETIQDRKERNLSVSILVFWLLYIVFAFFCSSRIALYFTREITHLSNRIDFFVDSNFSSRLSLSYSNNKNEVGKLWNNFIRMESEIVEHIELFKQKVDSKTLELFEKNQQIELQKDKLQKQVKISKEKNKNLLDGMRYAWRIQQALIPDGKRLNKHLQKGFVFFQPRDIVSGDIYWTFKQKNIKEDVSIFSVVDCTGHGVPGAFMSILAVNAINYAVLNKRYNKPSRILQVSNNYVFRTMKYYASPAGSNNVKDGMDMLLCKLNRQQKKLEYAGANRPLYILRKIRNKESYCIGLPEGQYKVEENQGALLFEIIPTKKTVGTQDKEASKTFENKEISVEKKDMIYLTTDGYADQFGGPKGKKFMVKRLKNLFALMHELDEEEQKTILKETFLDWKGNEDQVDDISVMGIRV